MSPAWQEATSLPAILAAVRRAAKGCRSPEVARFRMDAEREALALQRALRAAPGEPGAWRPRPGKRFEIRDPKPRTITVVPFSDRVVHHVVCVAAEADFERFAVFHSYACRPGKGQHAAVRAAQRFARGAPWVLKVDVAAFFASLPRDRLLALVDRRVRVPEAAAWLREIVEAGEGDRGLPIGALTSQHLANLYLGLLDHHCKDERGVRRYLRYMDDVLAFGQRDELARLRDELPRFLASELGLRLNERRTELRPTRDGVGFLGCRVYPGVVRVDRRRLWRFRRRFEAVERALARGRIDEEEAARRATSSFAHLQAMDTLRLRRRILARHGGQVRGGAPHGLQPGQPWRLLEERPQERAGRLPQQEAPVQRQRRPGLSPREHGANPPDGLRSRTQVQCMSADPSPVLRPGTPGPEAEAKGPGGGPLLGVVAGLLRGHE